MNSRIIEFMPEREQSSENSSKLHNEISHIDIVLFCVIVVIEQQTQQHSVIFFFIQDNGVGLGYMHYS